MEGNYNCQAWSTESLEIKAVWRTIWAWSLEVYRQAMGRVLTVSPSCSRKWPENQFLEGQMAWEFPNIFRIASDFDSTVQQNRERNAWNIILRRNPTRLGVKRK